MIDGIERLVRQVPGRLAVIAVVAGTVFSAISGSTIATTAMLGSLMLPVMLARGYNPVLAAGPLMAIGAVDMLIPPSALTVLLGSLSGISISKLLIGGVVPGLVLSVAFVAYIVARVKLEPSLARNLEAYIEQDAFDLPDATLYDLAKTWAKAQPLDLRLHVSVHVSKGNFVLARRLCELQRTDSRIGFEASNQYYYVPADLAEKVLNCRDLLDRWLIEQRRKWNV